MSETILKIGLAELTTLRIKIGDVTSELPLTGQAIGEFTTQQVTLRKMNRADKDKLDALVCELAAAKGLLETIGIEFVLPEA